MLSLVLSGILALPGQDPCDGAPRTAEPFAPNLSDSGRIFRGTFSADGATLYYFRKQNLEQEDYRILVSRWRNGRWSPGERLDLGGDFSDLYPSVSPDGQRLVFASYRPAPGDTASKPNAYLWYAERRGDRWGEPRFIAPASRFGTYHSGPTIDATGTIRFGRTSADWRTSWQLTSVWTSTGYSPAREESAEAGLPWRTWRPKGHYVWGGQLSPRGDVALLDVSRLDPAGRRGPSDVWVSVGLGQGWTEPVPAGGGVNREGYENFLVFHPDGCSVVFVRNFSSFERVSLDALVAPARSGTIQTPQPELVQPGVVSVKGRNESFPAVDPVDGSLWFSVYDQNFDAQTIHRAPKIGEGWGASAPVPFSGQFGDRAPRFSPDGRRLYFTSNRPAPGHPAGDMNIWVAERTDRGWSEPKMVPAPVSTPNGRDIHAVALRDGSLLVPSNRPGGAGRSDIWKVDPAGTATNLGPPINDQLTQPDLYASPDGTWMILVVTGHPAGLGGDDLFVSQFRQGAWGELRHLGAGVNTAEYEYGPGVSPDGRFLYFTSHRSGDAEIYRIPLSALGLTR